MYTLEEANLSEASQMRSKIFIFSSCVFSAAAAGKKITLNIEEPKNGVTKAEIDAAMQVVVENNIFNTSGGDIVEAVEGRLRTATLNPIVE